MKAKSLLLGALLLGVLAYVVAAANSLRPFVQMTSSGGESCLTMKTSGLVGVEDMEFDHATGTLYLAAADRRGDPAFRPHDSAVFRFHPDKDALPVRLKALGLTAPLRLHGMGLLTLPSGERRLFFVQHGDAGESVDIFRLDEAGNVLRHVRTVRDPAFVSLNDVAPVGPESFYASNDHGRPPRLGHLLEDFAFLSNSSVVYFDGTAGRKVATGLRYANGVLADPGGRYLVVAETTASRLTVFERQSDGGLKQVGRTEVDTSPDNLTQDENGDYLIGAHPSLLQFLRHAHDLRRRSASQALRFRLGPDGKPGTPKSFWTDDGRIFSGSSVAAAHGSYWLIGGVFQEGVLLCRIDQR